MVEKQTNRKVKKLRTDNGLEFCNDKFNQYCRKEGILRHLTVPGTPQQNGLAERMNRTLLERVRCMLTNVGLPRIFWAEAVKTASYLINRCSSTAIDLKTPQEAWSGRSSDYSHIRVFGCTAYAHSKEDKLQPRAKKCIFLGFPEGVKGYRLWCVEPGKEKCIVSRDVVFNEDEMPYKVMSRCTDSKSQVQIPTTVNLDNKVTLSSGGELIYENALTDHEGESPKNLDKYQLARDRQRRTINVPQRLGYADLITYAFLVAKEINEIEPLDYEQAISCKNKDKWITAMEEEMHSLKKNKTWTLVDKPINQRLVGCKWIFKIKDPIPGLQGKRHKARLVAKGFT